MARILSFFWGVLVSGINLIASFLQQATAQGTRLTVLNPLGWFLATCIMGLLGSVHYQADFWIQILMAGLAGLGGLLFLGTYIFCLCTNQPELLRTEKYLIQQLAIEKGFRGDSTTGPIIGNRSAHAAIELPQKIDENGIEA